MSQHKLHQEYIQSLYYDKSLQLEGRAAQRRSLLRDPAKASPMLKRAFSDRINMQGSFDSSGLGLTIPTNPETYARHVCPQTEKGASVYT